MAQLGDRIKYLRERNKLTQEELAVKSMLTIVQISRYESNLRKPDPEALIRLTDSLDTNSDYLLGISDDPNPSSNAGRAYLGGAEKYTQEELDVAEAAIVAYRKALEKRNK